MRADGGGLDVWFPVRLVGSPGILLPAALEI